MPVGDTWKVGYADYEVVPMVPQRHSVLDGHCDHYLQEIEVHPAMRPQKAIATEIHELLHAMISVYGVPVGDKEEEVVLALEPAITSWLRDNKPLVRKLLTKLK